MIDRIANEIMLASRIMHTNNISAIAGELGYKPMLLINALYFGTESGKFVYDKKKDIITIDPEVVVEQLEVTEGLQELREQIEIFVGYLNGDEKDMSLEELVVMLGNSTPKLHCQIATATSQKLTAYQLLDPKDKQSEYTFYTLNENKDKLWGQKQFSTADSKAAKRAKRNK